MVEANNYKKVPVGLSFAGEKGYEALEVLKKTKTYKKSELVVELLLIYKKAQEIFGENNTLAKLWVELENLQEKSK